MNVILICYASKGARTRSRLIGCTRNQVVVTKMYKLQLFTGRFDESIALRRSIYDQLCVVVAVVIEKFELVIMKPSLNSLRDPRGGSRTKIYGYIHGSTSAARGQHCKRSIMQNLLY